MGQDTGALAAPGFNALIDSAATGWASSPDTAAAELPALNRGSTARSRSTTTKRPAKTRQS